MADEDPLKIRLRFDLGDGNMLSADSISESNRDSVSAQKSCFGEYCQWESFERGNIKSRSR